MSRLLMVSDASAREPEALARQVRSALAPEGYMVETAADTAEAVTRLRQEDFSVLIVQVASVWQCSGGVRLLLAEVRESSKQTGKGPKVLLFSDRGGDGAVAEDYWGMLSPMLLSHAFQANELRAHVRRMVERA